MYRTLFLFLVSVAAACAQDIRWNGTPYSAISNQSYMVNVSTAPHIVGPTTTIYKNGLFFASGHSSMYGAYGYSTDSGAPKVSYTATAVDQNGASFYGARDVLITASAAPTIDELNVPRSVLAGQTFAVSFTVSDTTENLHSVGLRREGFGLVGGPEQEGHWMISGGSATKGPIMLTAPTTAGTIRLRVEVWDATTGITGDWVEIPVLVDAAPGRGLTAEYFNTVDLSGSPVLTRTDASVNFNWGEGAPAAGINTNNFSVRWTGSIQARYTGTHTFATTSDDGVRLWVNGVQVINNWTDHAPTENTGTIALTKDQTYSIKMEFYDKAYGAVAKLAWSCPPYQPQETVPNSQLWVTGVPVPTALSPTSVTETSFVANWSRISSAASYRLDVLNSTGAFVIQDRDVGNVTSYSVTGLTTGARYSYRVRAYSVGNTSANSNTVTMDLGLKGLKAEYFANKTLTGTPTLERTDGNIGFDWGEGSPGTGVGTDNFSVRWTGQVTPRYSQTYTFTTRSDDGVRLWVNGVQLVNNWTDHAAIDNSGTIALTAGQKYDIKMEFYDAVYGAVAKLSWQSPSQTLELVPQSQLSPPPAPVLLAPSITTQPAALTVGVTQTATFSVTASGSPAPTYQWRKDGSLLAGQTAATLTLTNVQAANGGNYSVVVTNSVGSVTSSNALLTVIPRQTTITPNTTQTIQQNGTITFSSTATSPTNSMTAHEFCWKGPNGRWSWQGGAAGLTLNAEAKLYFDPKGSNTRTVTVTGVSPGTYQVYFGGSDSGGWFDSQIITLNVGTVTDVDNDGLSDQWETSQFGNLNHTALGDADADGLTNVAELNLRTNAAQANQSSAEDGGALDAAWPAASTPSDHVGALAGTPSVNLNGAATYSVPLQVSPGTLGMQPKLSLEYSSQGGDGYLGLGWQLRGLPAITRGPATRATDGVSTGMNFSTSDKFYLDGSRLVAIAGAYGAHGTEYRTEIDAFSKIVSHGSAGSGPASFIVWTKAGQILELGATEDSRLTPGTRAEALVWGVNKISDLSGNAINVTYSRDNATGEMVPSAIAYTCNSAAPNGYASVGFAYEQRSDPQVGYAYETKVTTGKRLRTITVKVGESVFRQYRLGYDDNTPARLTSIQEAADELTQNSKVYPPTVFDYYAPRAEGMDKTSKQILSGNGTASLGADMDGDGLTDFIQIHNKNAAWVGFYRNDGENFGNRSDQLMLSGGEFETSWFLTTDINGDGRSELIVRPETYLLPAGKVRSTQWNPASGGLTPVVEIPVAGYQSMDAMDIPCYSADFTGDGRDDLLQILKRDHTSFSELQLLVSNGVSYTAYRYDVSLMQAGSIDIGDFTGDGVADVLNVCGSASDRRARVFKISTTGVTMADETYLGAKPTESRVLLGDVNGDGQLDLLYCYRGVNGAVTEANRVEVWSRTGNRFVKTAEQFVGGWNPTHFRYVPFDYDGDRRTDLAILFKPSANTTNLDIWRATGDATTPFAGRGEGVIYDRWFASPAGNSTPLYNITPAQLDEDGLGDLLFVGLMPTTSATTEDSQNTHVARLRSLSSPTEEAGAFPNLLKAVANGLGVKTTFTYLSLLSDDIYTKGTGSVFPEADVRPPFKVVSMMTADRPGGGAASHIYSYAGLKVSALRGLLGFASITRSEMTTGLETTRSFFQGFPFTGLPKTSEIRNTHLATRPLVKRVEHTVRPEAGSISVFTYGTESRRVYRPLVDSTYTNEYGLDGQAARSSFEQTTADAYGNTTVHYSRFAEGEVAASQLRPEVPLPAGQFERRLTTTYNIDVADTWLVARPHRAENYAKSGDFAADAITRVSEVKEYYTGSDQPKVVVEEPDTGREAYRLTKTFGYDTFGNRTSTEISSVSGLDGSIETRGETSDYSATAEHPVAGRFVGSTTDALGYKMTYHFDSVTGAPKKQTHVATGMIKSWQYDAFGRQTQEVLPDSTTTIAHRWDATAVSYGQSLSATAKYHIDVRVSGGSPVLTRFDAFGNALQTLAVGGDGKTRTAEKRYDAEGNTMAESRPHLADGTVYWTTTTYDELGRPAERLVAAPPADGGTGVAYDRWSWGYGGRTIDETNARGHTTRHTLNALGARASTVNNPTFAATAPDRGSLGFKYDGFGQVREATDAAGHMVRTKYDLLGRKIEVDDPNAGKWANTYYADGLVRTQADAKNNLTTFKYDKLGRLTDRENGTTRKVHWDYLPAGTSTVAGAGQPDKVVVTENGAEIYRQSWAYDEKSRVKSTTRTIGGSAYVFGQQYDAEGRPSVATYPSNHGVAFATINSYNALGALKEVRRYDETYPNKKGAIYWSAQAYEADGQLGTAHFGNGLVHDRIHSEQNGRPEGDALSVVPASPGAPAFTFTQSYSFDGVGNLSARGVTFVDPTTAAAADYSEVFSYDAMNRLLDVKQDGGTTATHTYVYDQIGNITSKDGQAMNYVRTDGTEPLAPHGVRSVAGVTYSYDPNGNIKSNTAGLTVTWRTNNQPDRITRGTAWNEFVYGAGDERITQKSQDGTIVHYVGGSYEVTIPAGTTANTQIRAFVSTPSGRTAVAQFNAAGVSQGTSYLIQDQLGSTSLVTDERGALRERFSYDAWGAPRDPGTAVNGAWPSRLATTRGFTDHEMLTGVQLVHMNGRVYDPKLGRFLSPDPLVNSADGTQAYNRYAYVRNNPLSVTDPTGLTGEDIVSMPKFEVRGDRVNSDLSLGNWRNTGILLGLQPYTGAGLTNGATLPSFSQAHFNYLEPQSIMSDGDPNDARLWGHLLALDAIMQYWDEKENNTGWWAWIFSKKENPYKDEYLHAFTSTSAYQNAVMTGNLMLVFAGGGGGAARGTILRSGAGRATVAAEKMTLAMPGGSQTAMAQYVRTIGRGEKVANLVNDGKALTWVHEAEHAVFSLNNGQRVLVRGGRDGIDLLKFDGKLFFEMNGELTQVRRVLGHTHPRVTGPSAGDMSILKTLGQESSYLFELGLNGSTRFGPK